MNIKHLLWFLFTLLTVALFTGSVAAQTSGDREYHYKISASLIASVGYYHAISDQFGSQQRIPDIPGIGGLSVNGGPFLTTDLFGESTTVATITSGGDVLNGRYSWIGSSETLGIATGTTWLSATIMTGNYDITSGGAIKLIGRVDTMSPVLLSIIGPVKFIEIQEFFEPAPAGSPDPWGETWVNTSYLGGPDVRLSSNALPITPDEMRATTRLFPGEFLAFTTSYDAVTDIYSATGAIVGSGKSPNLYRLSDNMPFGVDTVSNFSLSASVDDTGTSQGGTMSWVGRIPSLGIPSDVLLMEGTPVEVAYYDGGRFQFLINVTHLAPELEAVIGPVRSFVFYDFQDPFPFATDPWAGSWLSDPPGSAPPSYFTDEPLWITDLDADGIANELDNCVLISNGDQRDVDGDNIGSRCDVDFNNDCIVNFLDIAYFSSVFLSSDALADINGDGSVNFIDYATVVQQFALDYMETNPSGVANPCSSD